MGAEDLGIGSAVAATIHMSATGLATPDTGTITFAGATGVDSFVGFGTIFGGQGDDSFFASADSVTFVGENGADTFIAANLATPTVFIGSSVDDLFIGGNSVNTADFTGVTTSISFDLSENTDETYDLAVYSGPTSRCISACRTSRSKAAITATISISGVPSAIKAAR